MSTRITQQLGKMEHYLRCCRSDPDWPELLTLAETAGLSVDVPRLLSFYTPGYGIEIERARGELGDALASGRPKTPGHRDRASKPLGVARMKTQMYVDSPLRQRQTRTLPYVQLGSAGVWRGIRRPGGSGPE